MAARTTVLSFTTPLAKYVMRLDWALARKMAVVMHAMWRDGAVYIGDATTRAEDVAARAAVKNRKLLGAHA